jgi:hypothetical protein
MNTEQSSAAHCPQARTLDKSTVRRVSIRAMLRALHSKAKPTRVKTLDGVWQWQFNLSRVPWETKHFYVPVHNAKRDKIAAAARLARAGQPEALAEFRDFEGMYCLLRSPLPSKFYHEDVWDDEGRCYRRQQVELKQWGGPALWVFTNYSRLEPAF